MCILQNHLRYVCIYLCLYFCTNSIMTNRLASFLQHDDDVVLPAIARPHHDVIHLRTSTAVSTDTNLQVMFSQVQLFQEYMMSIMKLTFLLAG